MESVTTFMDIFARNWREKNAEDLRRLLQDAPSKYFRDPPSNKKGLILLEIFNEQYGLIKFLKEEVIQDDFSKGYAIVLSEAFKVLDFLMKEYADTYEPYVYSTADICIDALRAKSGFYVKREAASVFRNLLKSFPDIELPVDAIVDECMTKIHLFGNMEEPLVLKALCSIARFRTNSQSIKQKQERIRKRLMNLYDLSHPEKKGQSIINLQICIESLTDLSYCCRIKADEKRGLYELIKKASEIAKTPLNKSLLESIILFMIEMMPQFPEYIRNDHKYWKDFFDDFSRDPSHKNLSINALQVFYKEIAKILNKEHSARNEIVIRSFKDSFMKRLTDGSLDYEDQRTAVIGYSQFVEPIKNFFNNDAVVEMFNLITRRTIPLYFSEEDSQQLFGGIADYQEALSRILVHISNISIDQIKILSKLTTLMIKRFPELSPADKIYSTQSLKKTIINVSKIKPHLFNRFISIVIFDGIVWSCSHTLCIDAELKSDLQNSNKRPICYKDYVEMWKSLLVNRDLREDDVYNRIQHHVVNAILETCLTLSLKLNLTVKTKEGNIFYDPALSETAENEADFRIFLNLVDLYDEILPEIKKNHWTNKLQDFLYKIIRASYEYPLISGFYRLVSRTLNSSQAFCEADDSEIFQMVLQYLLNTLDKVCKFPLELQVYCVQFILQVPQIFIPRLIDRVLPIFKIALNIGLDDYNFANITLDALETYISQCEANKVKDIFREIVPLLNSYLKGKESLEINQEVSTIAGKKLQKSDDGFETVQNRILLLFGRVDNSLMLEFLHKESEKTGATWDEKKLLEYSMTFPDGSLDVYLDTLLPRIIELSLKCSDRRTKVAASEAFYSIVAIILGKTMQFLASDPDRYSSLYKVLCPALLRLGCDSDDVVKQLFNPLMLQLTHWLSSRFMEYSPAVEHLIDCLFDGLCDESNFSVRDFSGICLAEFAKWSIKQSTDHQLSQNPILLKRIVENIKNFALHPWSCRRVAAAIAFNHLYKILRENEHVVNNFWLEFLHCFVKSIDGCNEKCIREALSHVERVLIAKSAVFFNPDPNRKIPDEFIGGTLEEASHWLLNQCGELDRSAAKCVMAVFENLSSNVASFISPKNVITHYLEHYHLEGLNDNFLGKLNESIVEMSEQQLIKLLKNLDGYNWLLKNQFIDADVLFSSTNPQRFVIFTCIQNFINYPMEINFLQCETILTILDFSLTILKTEFSNKVEIHNKLFTENSFLLLTRCALVPQELGFDMKNPNATEQLPEKLEKLFIAVKTELSAQQIQEMINVMNCNVNRICDWSEAFDFQELTSQWREPMDLKIIHGLILLQKCNFLNELDLGRRLNEHREEKYLEIFNGLKMSGRDQNICVDLDQPIKLHVEHCLELLLYQKVPIVALQNLIADKTELFRDGDLMIFHGEYFFNVFQDVLFRCSLKTLDGTLEALIGMLHQQADIVFFFMEEMAIWMQHNRTENIQLSEKFARLVLKNFSELESKVINLTNRGKSFCNILRIVVRLMRDPPDAREQFQEFYTWILQGLTENDDISVKTQMLNDFLICLTNEKSSDNLELQLALRNLKIHRGMMTLSELQKNTLESMKILECFQTLMTMLPITKSIIVLEAAINFGMGIGDFLCNNATDDQLKLYFNTISEENASKALEHVYRLFMNSSVTPERFDMLEKFLIPAFKVCKPTVVEKFFECNINEIFSIINESIPESSADFKKTVVSKIGSYNLLEFMFVNVERKKIDQSDGLISMKAFGRQDNKLTVKILQTTLNVRKLKTSDVENKEIMRLLHCAAYNCCITIASTSNESRYYLALFSEDRNKDQLIWEKIIDCEKSYSLSQTFRQFPKKKKALVNIRNMVKKRQNSDELNYSYIKSYNLASSTLTEDIYAYDLNEVIPMQEPTNDIASFILEEDELNKHECMYQICGIMEKIMEYKLNSKNRDESNSNWLNGFVSSMSSRYTNVKLFLLKIILNNQQVFKTVAETLLGPTMDTIMKLLKDAQINYIITDALLVLIDWANDVIPQNENIEKANNMFSLIIDKIDEKVTAEYIVRYNFTIVDMLVKVWHEFLDVPKCLDKKMKEKPERAVRIILIILSNNMGDKLVHREDVLNFLINTLEKYWNDKEDMVLHTCESIGLFLKVSESQEYFEERKITIVEKLRNIWCIIREPKRLVKCIKAMCEAYPQLSSIFSEFVLRNHLKLAAQYKARSMEVFYHMISDLTPEKILEEMKQLEFNDLLKSKVLHCEIICLKIIKKLVPILNAKQLISLAKLAKVYSEHDHQEYREITYNIFIDIYKKYIDDISSDEDGLRLIDLSKQILLPGLLEPSECLQQKLTTFWTEETKFGKNCPERILDILNIYSAVVEKDFLPILGIIFLHLSKESPDYERTMFGPMKADCNYQNYKVAVSWRMKNLRYRVPPLFASSYASQCSQRLTACTLDDFVATNEGLMLRATNTPEFQATFANNTFVAGPSEIINHNDGVFLVPEVPSYNIVSKRFLQETKQYTTRRNNSSDYQVREENLKKLSMRQRSSVRLSRSYRYGDFPDTEITHSTVLNPLQELLKKDQIICKNFVVSMINSLIKRLASSRQPGPREKYQSFINNISKRFRLILENCRGNGLLISAILEILFQNSDIEFDYNIVAHVSKITGLNNLGALLLERNLLNDSDDECPASKKIRRDDGSSASSSLMKMDLWVQLAGLYETTYDVDVFLNIFQNHVAHEHLHRASIARAASRWDLAKEAYGRAFYLETRAIQRHCRQGIYECMARLSDWNELTVKIDEDFEGKSLKDFLAIARSPEEGWVTSWYLRAHLYLYQKNPDENEIFLEEINELRNIPKIEKRLQEFFGDQLALFYSFENQEEAREQIRKSLKTIREQWIQLSNLSLQRRTQQITKLQGLCNIDMFRRVSKDLSNIETMLLKYWSESYPTQYDDLLLWDIQINHRSNFSRQLCEKLESRGNDDDSQLPNPSNMIKASIAKQRFWMSDAALKQKNTSLFDKWLDEARDEPGDLFKAFVLKKAECIYQEALLGGDKVQCYTKCWKRCHKVLQKEEGITDDNESRIAALHLLSDIGLSLKALSVENRNDFNSIIRKIGNIDDLDAYSLEKLIESSVIADEKDFKSEKIGDCHLKILKFCYMKIIRNEVTPELVKKFVESTLNAMRYGSQEAGHYFPCLLKSEYLSDPTVKNVFARSCKKVPSWRFLAWQSQLLLNSYTDLEDVVSPIIERLADDYPNALVYTLHGCGHPNPDFETSATILKIKQKLCFLDVNRFIEAMHFLVRPELFLEYYLKKLLNDLNLGSHTVVDRLLKKVFITPEIPSMRGKLYEKINKYRVDIESIRDMPIEAVEGHVMKILNSLKEEKRRDSTILAEYSPWLNRFTGSKLEIPGQYIGDKKPHPKYHAKITKIESKIQVMTSLRRPIRITIVGNDAKNYKFLVKFGEDLRLDQTVEQAFSIMNGILKTNMACAQRNLSINTYQVIPLSESMGIIQWLDGTKTLGDYLHFSLTNPQKQQLGSILNEYEEWIREAKPDTRNKILQYKEAILNYDSKTVIEKMKNLIAKTKSDMLKETFIKLNPSPESFMSSRRNFIVSYSTMCAVHWILGVGDRHLSNVLISIESGRCTGIDFDAAFGGGIDQSIPELVPFRLTNQITGLMKPFDERDLFGVTLTHVIRALRNEKGPIIASIDGIVHQKLTWNKNTKKGIIKADNDGWVPRKKINSVLKKLGGVKPSVITLEDLENQHHDEYYEKYKIIVGGFDFIELSQRMNMKEDQLTPEEQVKCLLEQATDLNILGRTYANWMPWL